MVSIKFLKKKKNISLAECNDSYNSAKSEIFYEFNFAESKCY